MHCLHLHRVQPACTGTLSSSAEHCCLSICTVVSLLTAFGLQLRCALRPEKCGGELEQHLRSGMMLDVRVTMPLTEIRLSTSPGLRSLITLVSLRLYGLHCTHQPAFSQLAEAQNPVCFARPEALPGLLITLLAA